MQEVCLLPNLYDKIVGDLKRLNLPVDEVYIFLRPYSKTYLGRYYPIELSNMDKPKIFLYPYASSRGHILEYDKVFSSAVHEMIHHIQLSNPTFKRVNGVMHDPQFWCLYNFYIRRAQKYHIIRKEKKSEVKVY